MKRVYCNNCEFVDHITSTLHICRLNPPKIFIVNRTDETMWPSVDPDRDWCGKGKAASSNEAKDMMGIVDQVEENYRLMNEVEKKLRAATVTIDRCDFLSAYLKAIGIKHFNYLGSIYDGTIRTLWISPYSDGIAANVRHFLNTKLTLISCGKILPSHPSEK